jgi:hypothetical protein
LVYFTTAYEQSLERKISPFATSIHIGNSRLSKTGGILPPENPDLLMLAQVCFAKSCQTTYPSSVKKVVEIAFR